MTIKVVSCRSLWSRGSCIRIIQSVFASDPCVRSENVDYSPDICMVWGQLHGLSPGVKVKQKTGQLLVPQLTYPSHSILS